MKEFKIEGVGRRYAVDCPNRRAAAVSTRPTRSEELELDLQRYELRRGDAVLRLEKIPMELLILLVEHKDQLVSREEIIEKLWGKDVFLDTEQGINTAIRKIRQVLHDDPGRPRFVQTVFGKGYRFVAPILVTHNGLQSRTVTRTPLVLPEADREDRYQSANDIFVDLRHLESRSAEIALPSARRGKSARWTLAILAGVAVIVLAGMALGIYFWKSRPVALNLERMHIAWLTDSGMAEDVAISPDGQYVVYVLRDGEKRSLNVRQVATGSDIQILAPDVVLLRSLAFSPDGNYIFFTRTDQENFKIGSLYQMPVLGGTPHALIRHVDSPISFSPDGKQFAFVREDAANNMDELIIANADGSGERVLARPGPGPEVGPAWSPDGKTIAITAYDFKGGRYIWAVSPSDGSKRLIYSTHTLIGRAVWLPDGSGLLAAIGDPAQGDQGQLWYIAYPGGGAKRFTNDLTNYNNVVLDLTRDAKSLVTVGNTTSSDWWVVPAGDTAHARRITSDRSAVHFISAGPDGSLVFMNSKGGLSSIHDDGHVRAFAATNMHNVQKPSACRDGRHIVFASEIEGRWNIWRMDADGSNVTQLTQSGSAIWPVCSPDSQWVLYCDPQGRWRIPIGGGTPTSVQMKNAFGPWMTYSPDGKFIAYNSNGWEVPPLDRMTVSPSTGGQPLHSFSWPSGSSSLHWAPDGSGLDYILTRNRVGNIWRQRLPKGPPRQVTNFTSGLLFSFDWSPDGQQLYVARGTISSDVVLITNFR
jgi:Tol biopolymer transport system component/DNA-binding winged helix-turn-helix (wHTH) protein